MKTYKHLYPQIYTWENLETTYRKARKGKRRHQPVADFEYTWEKPQRDAWPVSGAWRLTSGEYKIATPPLVTPLASERWGVAPQKLLTYMAVYVSFSIRYSSTRP